MKIEEFKVFVEKIVTANKSVKTGLLAKLKTKKKQSKNLSHLISEKIIQPILSGKVIVPKIIGEIEEVTNPHILKMMKPNQNEFIIKYTVKIDLDQSFVENFTRVLDEVAEKKFTGYDQRFRKCGKGAHKCRQYSLIVGTGSLFGDLNYTYSGGKTYHRDNIIFSEN